MQKYKRLFIDESIINRTIGNIQSCIRLNDFENIGDGIHYLNFNMIGLFSFRHWSLQKTIEFWIDFLVNKLQLEIQYVTVHPDKEDWKSNYNNIEVKKDINCIWSDGEIGGYCTEFYINDIEIGNIVNPLGSCIDVGFGLERLDYIVNKTKPLTKIEELIKCFTVMVESGIVPCGKKHGFLLKRIIRELIKLDGSVDHVYFTDEVNRKNSLQSRYDFLKRKNSDKTDEWWKSTHGIDFTFINK